MTIMPSDIKEYVNDHPAGIAGESIQLVVMVNHFVQLALKECVDSINKKMYIGSLERIS